MNLSYIRYFVELAHVQHYTNAARNMNITQPSLSHAISQLEEELGVMLFEKNGRNTELTAFGREFLACAERSLGTLDAGVESIQKEAAGDGVIRLGLIRPLGMEFVPRLAAEYLKKAENRNVSFEGLGKAPEIACETEEDEVIAGLVAAGFGIAVVPYMDMLKRLDVKVLNIKHQLVDRLYYVVHDSRTYMSPVATKFHKYVLSSN